MNVNKINEKNIGKDTVKLTASKIMVTMITLISSMLLARFRSLEEYGTYSQLLMSVNLVCAFVMLGLPNSINYFLAKANTEEERSKFLSVYYTLNTILSILTGILLVLFIPLLEKIFSNECIRSFWYFLALFPWTKIIMSSVENLLIVYKKTYMLMSYRVANSIALLLVIALVQYFDGTFMVYMIMYLLVEIIFTLCTYWMAKSSSYSLTVLWDKKLIKSIMIFSIPIGVATMIGTLNIELDKLVITSFFTTEELAIYSNASRELPVTIIAASLTSVLLPQMVRLLQQEKVKEAVSLWKSATIISFAIICFVAIACVVFAPEVITILYSKKYLDGVSVFRIYSLALLLKATYYGMILNATGKTKFIMFSSVGSLALNFILNYLLYFSFGFNGPAFATLLSSLVMMLVQLFYTAKVCHIKAIDIFPWKDTGILMLLNICAGWVFYQIHKLLIQHLNSICSAIFLGCVWFIIMCIILYKPLLKQWRILNE